MRFSVSQLLLGLSCLSTAVLASSESLFIPHSQIEDRDSAFRNNATIETGADPFDLNGLEKRQRTYCPSGTRLCESKCRYQIALLITNKVFANSIRSLLSVAL